MNTKYQGLQRARAYGMPRTFARISETKTLLHYIAKAIIKDNFFFFFFFLQYKDKKIHIFIHVNTLSNDFKDVLR